MLTNRSAPSATIVPVLVYPDVAEAAAWLCATFGFTERLRMARGVTVAHAQLTFGDGAVMLGRAGGAYRPPQPDQISQYVHVTVDDVNRHYEAARQRGAEIVHPPADQPFGERQYTVRDLAGYWWTFSQHIADRAPEEWGAVSVRAEDAPV